MEFRGWSKKQCACREASSSDAILDTLHFSTVWALHCTKKTRFFTEFGLFWCKTSYIFAPFLALLYQNLLGLHRMFPLLMQDVIRFSRFLAPLHQKMSLGFSQDFPSSDAKFPTFHIFGPTVPKIVGSSQDCWVFTGFSSSDANFHMFFHIFGPTAPRIFQLSQDFPLLMQHFPHAHTNAHTLPTHTHTHHGASRICKILQKFWLKTISVCKAICYIFKNKSTRIYLCKAIFYIFGNYSPKQTFMYVIVLAGMVTSTNGHDNKRLKKGMATIPFFKILFLNQNTRKRGKLWSPLWKLGLQKSSETTTFKEQSDVDHLLTQQCGPPIDHKKPKCGPLIDPTTYIYML